MSGWILYLITALSIGITSYITIYKPAVELYVEILEDEDVLQTSWTAAILWILASTRAAPVIAITLLSGKNEKIIKDIVLGWLGHTEDE